MLGGTRILSMSGRELGLLWLLGGRICWLSLGLYLRFRLSGGLLSLSAVGVFCHQLLLETLATRPLELLVGYRLLSCCNSLLLHLLILSR